MLPTSVVTLWFCYFFLVYLCFYYCSQFFRSLLTSDREKQKVTVRIRRKRRRRGRVRLSMRLSRRRVR
uniref:Predicted gene, 56118 n=1 Tax=Mus musculus TaxID=10090 RepID=A0A494B9I6_MOUSE